MDTAGNFKFRFFNAGNRIVRTFKFSISETSAGFNGDSKAKDSIGYWVLRAERNSWFDVPNEIASGNEEAIRVNFKADLLANRANRGELSGVVLLDPTWNPEKEETGNEGEVDLRKYPFAPTEELVIERATKLWSLFTREVVQTHLADAEAARAAGGSPLAARGFTKHCLNLHGITDPAEQYFNTLKSGKQNDSLTAQLIQQNQTMMTIVLALATGQKIDPEALKGLVAPAQSNGGAPIPGAPVVSGIATGEIKKPITGEDGWEKHTAKTRGKDARAKEAEAVL